MTWQPIETAPRDGTFMLVWGGDEDEAGIWIARVSDYTGRDQWWTQSLALLDAPVPTHWKPLPAPPNE